MEKTSGSSTPSQRACARYWIYYRLYQYFNIFIERECNVREIIVLLPITEGVRKGTMCNKVTDLGTTVVL